MHLSGRLVNLVEEGFDLAFRAAAPGSLDLGLIAKPIVDMPFVAVASPAYLDRTGRPRELSDLNGGALLMYSGARPGSLVPFETPDGQQAVQLTSLCRAETSPCCSMPQSRDLGSRYFPSSWWKATLRQGASRRSCQASPR